uniref:RNase H domain-containing protein n=1 Tax=Heterorhabditis bacteriophora TaxID=37862 RepID=A0A1I7WA26_HETBA
MSIPRKIGPTDLNCPISLWVFVDASAKAYACCAYLSHGLLGTSKLVSGKIELTPLKRNITIPRLELVALLLGIRLAHSIIMSLRKEAIYIRIVGDSKVALCWLTTSRSLPVFVRNQVKRILKIREELLKLSKSVTLTHRTQALEGVREINFCPHYGLTVQLGVI